jgi:FMN-dependent NADH-azoreductase
LSILHIDSSGRLEKSHSRKLTSYMVDKLKHKTKKKLSIDMEVTAKTLPLLINIVSARMREQVLEALSQSAIGRLRLGKKC